MPTNVSRTQKTLPHHQDTLKSTLEVGKIGFLVLVGKE